MTSVRELLAVCFHAGQTGWVTSLHCAVGVGQPLGGRGDKGWKVVPVLGRRSVAVWGKQRTSGCSPAFAAAAMDHETLSILAHSETQIC